ncbi:hypothetical protein [Myxococcus sp. Y35]|uniref:hypothetical protein n=1 Tax=Pseudomyxococcus flavus TaxID=3115648 RepID=UPI003CF72488
MNVLSLSVERLTDGRWVDKEGIRFSESALIKVSIDGEDIEQIEAFRDSLVVFEELEKSAGASGNYLIFTCACGMAEDGGWEGVKVVVEESTLSWSVDVGPAPVHFVFERSNYVAEIESVRKMLEVEPLPLEPRAVGFPMNFKR